MKAIRGAITIDQDNAENVKDAVFELMNEIVQKNNLNKENIVSIIFSTTSDIHSFYPAKAAREAGFSECALFSAVEPEITGSLPLCIRAMILCENTEKVSHIYLRRAANLRKDLAKFNIALDGPSGSGKSTVAKLLAKEFDILYLDTGAMYRACALKVLESGVPNEEKFVKPIMDALDLKVLYVNGSQHTVLDGKDVSEAIRRPEVSMAASAVSALKCVREKMVEMQRKIASEQSCVLDGRDIGTYVLPDAQFKFYITADSMVRAKRRFKELQEKGYSVDLKKLHEEIQQRDYNDSTREFSPLRKADDAVEIDTSSYTIEEVVTLIRKKIQEMV